MFFFCKVDLVVTLVDRLLANADDIVRYNIVSVEATVAASEGDEDGALVTSNSLSVTTIHLLLYFWFVK